MDEPKKPQKRERPRDELGRPLAWDAQNLLEMEDFDALSAEENHRLAIAHFNAGRFFQAHEAWETAWKKTKGSGDEEFFKGLSQLGAGYVHHARGNPHGTHTLIRRAVSRIRPYGPRHRGVDVEAVAGQAEAHALQVEEAERAGDALPPLEAPTV